MAVIIKRGEAHKMHVWTTSCDLCDSRLKLFEDLSDPAVEKFGSCGTNTVYVTYTCPVCNETQRAYAHEFDDHGTNPKEIIFGDYRKHAIEHETKREYRALTKDERVELQSYAKTEEEPDNEPFFIE